MKGGAGVMSRRQCSFLNACFDLTDSIICSDPVFYSFQIVIMFFECFLWDDLLYWDQRQ